MTSPDFHDHVLQALTELTRAGLRRQPRTIHSPQGPEVVIDGRQVVCLCSNNYLGLADHPELIASAQAAAQRHGVGSGASRHISGTMQPHRQAEERLAQFVAAPRALLFATGYAANVGTIQALVGPGDAVYSDALNHASLIDGTRLSRAAVHVYDHCNCNHLEELLRRRDPARRALVVSDAVFSMDGDSAPVADLRALSHRHGAGLLIDEAHALGVLGPAGRGLCAERAVQPDILIGTLGKAFGTAGAFAAADQRSIELIENRARSYIFSTAPPPALAHAARTAVDLVEAADTRRAQLRARAAQLRQLLRDAGFEVTGGQSPILPIVIGEPEETMRLSAALLELGVFVHGIRPPTVPTGTSRLRVTAMATLTDAHLERVRSAFSEISRCRNLP